MDSLFFCLKKYISIESEYLCGEKITIPMHLNWIFSVMMGLFACQNKPVPIDVVNKPTELQKAAVTLPTATNNIQRLVDAYPDHLSHIEGNNLVWRDGTKMVIDDGKNYTDYLQLLANADLSEQMSTPYPTGDVQMPPAHNSDPGRVRYEKFFRKMYGNSAAEVKANAVSVDWFGTSLLVTKVNNVDGRLRAVRDELLNKPHLKKYLVVPGGTFNWRIISRTTRLSMHSFGIAIDINTKFTDYWQWDKAQEGSPNIRYKNRIPYEIAEVFERNGFIWGGKWYHYDTMHFEYRPELL